MATIDKYKIQNGVRYRVRWRDDQGKQRTKSFDRSKNANEFKTNLEYQLRNGSYVAESVITVREFLNSWMKIKSKTIADNTIVAYNKSIDHINEHIGDMRLQKVTAVNIDTMYATLQEGLSGTTVLHLHRVLNQALKQAEKQQLINRNPCIYVDAPKKNKNNKAKFIHPDDISNYIKAFEGSYLYMGVVIAMFTGLRRGEVLGLQWQDVDFKRNMLNIRHNMTYKGLRLPKSQEIRTVPMSNTVSKLLRQHKKRCLENKLVLGSDYFTSDFVVTREDGRLIDPREFSRQFGKVLKRNNLEHVRFHDLRHTTASLLIHEGEDMKTISEILGHSSISITADLYGHVLDEKKKGAINSLEKYL
jgi:integrase